MNSVYVWVITQARLEMKIKVLGQNEGLGLAS